MLLGPHTGIRLPSRASIEDLVVVVEAPDRQLHQPDHVELQDHKISVRYTPFQVGTHLIDIFYRGSRIRGSPFQFYVDSGGLQRSGGVDMGVRVSENRDSSSSFSAAYRGGTGGSSSSEFQRQAFGGISSGGNRLAFNRQVAPVSEVGVCHQLRLRSADGSDLDKSMLVAFDGPEKVDVDLEELSRREYQLSYTFFAPGDYLMRVLVGGADIQSPIPVKVVGDVIGASSSGSFFAARESDGAAAAAAAASASNGAWFSSARHLNLGDSAFQQAVGEQLRHSDAADIYGEGLERGWSGRECSFEVQLPSHATNESGPLTVTVDGPSKVDLLYDEVAHNLFRFRYIPTAPGDYYVAIKLGPGLRHVLASPYKVTVH